MRNAYEQSQILMNGNGYAKWTKGNGGGAAYLTRCPAHSDKNPSLRVADGDRKRQVLYHCYAGCTFDAIKAALEARGWWEHPVSDRSLYVPIIPVPKDAHCPPNHGASHRYAYLDKDGELIGYIERFEVPEGGKDFKPLTWCRNQYGCASWVRQAFPEPRPLFGLDLLAAYSDMPCVIVEGEKAAVAARLLVGDKFLICTWPGGSNSVNRADWSPLKGRRIVIWPDADGPGAKAAEQVRAQLAKLDTPAAIVDLPLGLPEGWDAADAKAEGWTTEQALGLIARNDIALDQEFVQWERAHPEVWKSLRTKLVPIPLPYRRRLIERLVKLHEHR